jgi:hypothetical protein
MSCYSRQGQGAQNNMQASTRAWVNPMLPAGQREAFRRWRGYAMVRVMMLRGPNHLLLPLLAILGLLISTMIAPGFAFSPEKSGPAMTMSLSDMPCCPPENPVVPDCQKGCPLLSLCLIKYFQTVASVETFALDFVLVGQLHPGNDLRPEPTAMAPQLRPPRA